MKVNEPNLKYIVIISLVLVGGISSAYAVITITLDGNVVVTGTLDMTGDKITNVGTPTNPSDAVTKQYVDSSKFIQSPVTSNDIARDAITSKEILNNSITTADIADPILGNLNCSANQVPKWNGNNWVCTDMGGADTLMELSCSTNQIVIWDGAKWICSNDTDVDTTYDGTDFATSNQLCSAGMVVTGVDANGAVTCAADKDTDTKLSIKTFQKNAPRTPGVKNIITVECPPGWTPIGGGYRNVIWVLMYQNSIQLVSTPPDVWGWRVIGKAEAGSGQGTLSVYVHCANIPVDLTLQS